MGRHAPPLDGPGFRLATGSVGVDRGVVVAGTHRSWLARSGTGKWRNACLWREALGTPTRTSCPCWLVSWEARWCSRWATCSPVLARDPCVCTSSEASRTTPQATVQVTSRSSRVGCQGSAGSSAPQMATRLLRGRHRPRRRSRSRRHRLPRRVPWCRPTQQEIPVAPPSWTRSATQQAGSQLGRTRSTR